MSLPAYGLYRGDKLIASVRAENRSTAQYIFKVHAVGEHGDVVKRIKDAS